MSQSRLKAFKVLLSLFIIFQLVCVFVLPNPDSIIYRKFSPVLVTYGNLLGFNTTWRFFSPNPGIRVLQYEMFTRNEEGHLSGEVFQYPKPLLKNGSRENFNRKLYNAMYMIGSMDFLQNIMGPKMCSWHPGSESLSISMRGRVLPSIEKSKFLGSVREEIGKIETQYLTDVNCHKEPEE